MTKTILFLGIVTVLTACSQLAHASNYFPTFVGQVYSFPGDSKTYDARHVAITCDDEGECVAKVWGKPLACSDEMYVQADEINDGVPMRVELCQGRTLEFARDVSCSRMVEVMP